MVQAQALEIKLLKDENVELLKEIDSLRKGYGAPAPTSLQHDGHARLFLKAQQPDGLAVGLSKLMCHCAMRAQLRWRRKWHSYGQAVAGGWFRGS